ncbi:T9SS type A sorting domain-containing protein [Xanthomarina sp.]|uniref:T9SS type A sorting domain-containing protein n=1 Tax=Xanthomarina sp. TaxID=1931211 RepID=UPI002BCBFDD5|nr:T9SS type A sorting domain-containing protein [Xanthomarina sp.]HLV39448.1 T9SS type A sorting domain-containing protein [Xanthomarina sp.]
MKKLYFLLFTFCLLSSGAFAQGTETFTNHNLTSSYSTGSFVGDNNVTWNYTACRDENGDANGSGIDGKAILLRRVADASAISAQSGANGVGAVTMKLYKGFTGNGDRQVELFVNGTSYGVSEVFNDYDEHIFTVSGINVSGDVLIEITNTTSRQVIVDTVVWSEFGETISVNKNKTLDFSVFPNPVTNGYVNITSKSNEAINVTVFDILGKQVLSNSVNNNRLNVSKLTAGVYIMNMSQNGKITTKKLVIK